MKVLYGLVFVLVGLCCLLFSFVVRGRWKLRILMRNIFSINVFVFNIDGTAIGWSRVWGADVARLKH